MKLSDVCSIKESKKQHYLNRNLHKQSIFWSMFPGCVDVHFCLEISPIQAQILYMKII
uniref:Uncharacterized protein n=1 Tax=Arundo donax TaxID=35708 RepID=A0A0A9B586_ARUDO